MGTDRAALAALVARWRVISREYRDCGQIDAADAAFLCAEDLDALLRDAAHECERGCLFNCDAESACQCGAHRLYRAARSRQAALARVTAERDSLEGDARTLRGYIDTCSETPMMTWSRARAAERRAAQAVEALQTYGQHKPTCAQRQRRAVMERDDAGDLYIWDYVTDDKQTCTCKFAEALAASKGESV